MRERDNVEETKKKNAIGEKKESFDVSINHDLNQITTSARALTISMEK